MDTKLIDDLRDLLSSQRFGVLATRDEHGHPYTSLVAIAMEGHPSRLLFATLRATRKFKNMQGHPRVALLVDTRSNSEKDIREAMAVTFLGSIEELDEEAQSRGAQRLLEKHPAMEEFLRSPGCAVLRLKCARASAVTRFQWVRDVLFDGQER